MAVTSQDILASYNAKQAARAATHELAPKQDSPSDANVKLREIDPELLLGVVDPETFNCENVYNTFLALTSGWSNLERETKWFEIIHRIVPSKKYQYLFTAEEWRKIYVDFTGRTHLLSTPEFSL